MFLPLTLGFLLTVVTRVTAIKFSAEGVSVPDGVLRVNEDTELTCRYIMWKQERLYSVTWSLQYSGVKTDFFVYQANGRKDVKPGLSLVIVDQEASHDKSVTMMLTDGRENDVSICCDVIVLRDDGYGSMTTMEKEKCSAPIRVEAVRRRQTLVTVSLDASEKGRVGESIPLVCIGAGLTQYHRLQLRVGGVDTANRDYRHSRLEYMLTLQEEHFTPSRRGYSPQWQAGQLTVECLVLEGRNVVANSTSVIRQETRELLPIQAGLRSGFDRDARAFYTAAEHQSHHRGLPCHSYLLLQGRMDRGGSIVLGRMTDSVLEQIPSPARVGANRHETEMEPVMLLNLLGFHGYRVVSATGTQDNYMVWTLEKRNDEMHDEL